MLQLEDHPFARVQIPERAIDPAPDLPSLQGAFGVKLWPLVGDSLKVFGLAFFARRSLYLTPAFLPPEVVQAHVHHHTIEPGGEAGIETEALQRPVDLQESLLVQVLGFLRRAHHFEGEAQDFVVVQAHK